MNTCIVNGKRYDLPDNASISVIGNDVYVNGKKFVDGKDFKEKVINITIEGNVNELEAGSSDVKVHGNTGEIKCGSGDIVIKGDVNGNITTGSGDVTCGNVNGNVRTGSGDVSCGDIAQDVQTNSGDVSKSFNIGKKFLELFG